MPPARPLLIVLVAALLIAGCGSSGEQDPTATATTPEAPPGASARTCRGTVAAVEELRVTGVDCAVGLIVATAWTSEPSCAPAEESSRSSCSVHDGYRCLGATTDRGVAVSCARSGSSVAFLAKRD